jgi:transcriptional regulator with XRE-family HTH domain
MTTQIIDWPTLLLDYRNFHGLKQAAAAQDLGVSQSTISRWESAVGEPTVAVRNRLLRFARRQRSPMDAVGWVKTFKRIRALGLVVAPGNIVEAVTTPVARLLGVPEEALEGLHTHEIFDGDAAEINARRDEAGFFSGAVVSYEAATFTELNPQIGKASVYVHYVAWPHFGEDGRIRCVEQGMAVPRDVFLEVRRRLGGVLKASLLA